MRPALCALLLAVCVIADKKVNKRTKPFIADAAGNTLPPPSVLPATVGSPVNLLTPDRYEFYTFDDSGELVKRLMTLEEIQAIVAAGEDSDGLVTFANENQPTIAFNFSQPPFTKVHSVVTNVQNVLKAQMEAHKKQPPLRPTLDTPDVSDSWSLILPSIFGNTGVDITPDKATTNFSPETDMLENKLHKNDEEHQLSKEGESQLTTIADDPEIKMTTFSTTTEKLTTTTVAETTTSTMKPPTTQKISTTPKLVATTKTTPKITTTKPTTTKSTTAKPTTLRQSVTKPVTTAKPVTTRLATSRSTTTTPKPTTTVKSTTAKLTTTKPTTPKTVKNTQKATTTTKLTTTKRPVTSSSKTKAPTTDKPAEFERISTFIPISTVKYITERTTVLPVVSARPTESSTTTKRSQSTTTKISTTVAPKTTTIKPTTETTPTTSKKPELERMNATTVTTQSVSPSTAVTSTELISSEPSKPIQSDNNVVVRDTDGIIPMFDVAQSISQIASDLGSNYRPIPTTSNLVDTTKVVSDDMESKENIEIDIPATGTDNNSNNTMKNEDNFIKISTIDPHSQHKQEENKSETTIAAEVKVTTELATTENLDFSTTVSTNSDIISTTIDPILSESMGDLLSQIVNKAPQSLINSNENLGTEKDIITTEKILETTTDNFETTTLSSTTTSSSTTADIPVTKNNPSTTTAANKPSEKEVIEDKPSIAKITKVSAENNKIQEGKEKQNEQKNNDFVQISFSSENHTKNETKIPDLEGNKIVTNISKVSEITTTESNINESSEETTKIPEPVTTESSKVEITTKSILPTTINDKISQSNLNKIKPIDKTTNKHDKVESIPKIDDFKKKIQKVNIDDEELINERNNSWKLIPTVPPPKTNELPKDRIENPFTTDHIVDKNVVLEYSKENQGLEVTTKNLGSDIAQFTELCNELAFRYWHAMVENIDKRRSFVLSPYSITSMLAMMFMGARGATSGEMNDILKLDDMVTFNPHFTLKNISDSIETTPESGVIVSAFIRELYSDRNKAKILTFYKERAQHFYNGHVEEVNFKLISDIIRRRTNLLVKRYTWGKIPEYMKTNVISMKPPLAAFSANIYHTDCTGTSVDGRDGEMYFVVSPNIRQRRLVPVPAVVYKSGFLAGYDPVLDATVAALGNTNSITSTLFLMPGQQGNIVHSDDLEKLEKRLLDSNPTTPVWNRVLRTLLPRNGLELQIPRFSHKSVFNVSSTLQEMGLKDLFDADHADLGGLNGPSKDLYLSDMVQMTSFVTCGEGMVGDQHHVEEYPEATGLARRRTYRWINDWNEPRDYQRAFHDPHDVGEAMHLPLHLRPRQARLPTRSVQSARLKFDRPFLFFVRHNYSGMILYVGRYNPRLLP